jgi:hypothetical protein
VEKALACPLLTLAFLLPFAPSLFKNHRIPLSSTTLSPKSFFRSFLLHIPIMSDEVYEGAIGIDLGAHSPALQYFCNPTLRLRC